MLGVSEAMRGFSFSQSCGAHELLLPGCPPPLRPTTHPQLPQAGGYVSLGSSWSLSLRSDAWICCRRASTHSLTLADCADRTVETA